MSKISPFRAIRPSRDKVHLVATRPYYSYKKNVLEAKLEDNPYTFLHIINPEFGLNPDAKTDPNSDERFELVLERYDEFLKEGILIHEDVASLYVYRQTKNGHEFTGIIGGASIEEYENDKIKKHEATLTSRERVFTNYLNIVGYNAEPVLLSYQGNEHIDLLLEEVLSQRPEYEFSTTDRIKHELWKLNPLETIAFVKAFEDVSDLYIADGHHRSASSAGLKKMRSANPHNFPNEDFFLACMMDERKLKILEFNRLVRSLNNLSKEAFIAKLTEHFEVTKKNAIFKPTEEHTFGLYLQGEWYALQAKPSAIQQDHPVKSLDPQILTDFILSPILGIADLKTDPNISFMSGAETIQKLIEKVDSGMYAAAFILVPVNMEQVKRVADHQLIMPPKSTWVEPKLRSGLTIYNINE